MTTIIGRFSKKSPAPQLRRAPHAEVLDLPQRWTFVARQAFQLQGALTLLLAPGPTGREGMRPYVKNQKRGRQYI